MAGAEVRMPAVAGLFYPGDRQGLEAQLRGCFEAAGEPQPPPVVNDAGPREIIGIVSPHAGYQYSGKIAAQVFAELARDGRPEVFIVIGPNHGRGSYVNAIQTAGCWRTPLGEAPIDSALAAGLAEDLPHYEIGARHFAGEHSLEVQVPLIQYVFGPDAPIVPLMMLDQHVRDARELGTVLARHLEGRNAAIIASNDMTHFESAQQAMLQDRVLARQMEDLDPEGLITERDRHRISTCGAGPVAAMLYAARGLGATRARTIAYGNSGETTGSDHEVVGYLALAVRR